MIVTVFGGSGFLGSHVVDELLARGFKTRIFDLVPPLQPCEPGRLDFIQGDILNAGLVKEAVEGSHSVFHFAGVADLDYAQERPLETAQANLIGTLNILEACRSAQVGRFLYASSIYVHSQSGGFYRCSKHAAELFIEEYQRSHELSCTMIRYGSLYGPRSKPNNSVYHTIRHALSAGEVVYEGHPESMREYTHVIDAAKASVEMLKPEFAGKHVVISGQRIMAVRDFLKMISEILGIRKDVRFLPSSRPNHYVRTPYSYRPPMGLKYSPPIQIDLGQGLMRLIEDVSLEVRKSDP